MIFLALGTALCTGLAAIIISEFAVYSGGPLAISRWRSCAAAVALAVFCWLGGHWTGLRPQHVAALVGSSLAAAVLGEFFLNKAYQDLGARRAALLFSTAAPFSVVIGWLFLRERPSGSDLLGVLLVVSGLVCAIWFAPLHESRSQRHGEATASVIAIIGGLAAGLGQAFGNLMARAALVNGADPIAAMALRATVATAAFWTIWAGGRATGRTQIFSPPPRVLVAIICAALLSFAVGNTLLMMALSVGQTGIVTTFSATTPVLLLPLTWWRSGRCPNSHAWFGAVLTVIGIALITMF